MPAFRVRLSRITDYEVIVKARDEKAADRVACDLVAQAEAAKVRDASGEVVSNTGVQYDTVSIGAINPGSMQ